MNYVVIVKILCPVNSDRNPSIALSDSGLSLVKTALKTLSWQISMMSSVSSNVTLFKHYLLQINIPHNPNKGKKIGEARAYKEISLPITDIVTKTGLSVEEIERL
jgi:hypothetical protein